MASYCRTMTSSRVARSAVRSVTVLLVDPVRVILRFTARQDGSPRQARQSRRRGRAAEARLGIFFIVGDGETGLSMLVCQGGADCAAWYYGETRAHRDCLSARVRGQSKMGLWRSWERASMAW